MEAKGFGARLLLMVLLACLLLKVTPLCRIRRAAPRINPHPRYFKGIDRHCPRACEQSFEETNDLFDQKYKVEDDFNANSSKEHIQITVNLVASV